MAVNVNVNYGSNKYWKNSVIVGTRHLLAQSHQKDHLTKTTFFCYMF